MKKYLRIITFVLAIIMVIASFGKVKAADEEKPVVELKSNKTSIKAGDTIEVTINVKYLEGFTGMGARLKYSSNLVFQKDDIEVDERFESNSDTKSNGDFYILINPSSKYTSSVKTALDVAVLKFKIADTVKEGDKITISLDDITVGTDDVEADDETLTLTVGATNAPDQPNQDDDENKTNEEPKDTEEPTDTPSQEQPKKDEEKSKQDGTTGTNGGGSKETGDTAGKKIDYAGAEDYAFGFIAVILIGGISFIQYRKYKNI